VTITDHEQSESVAAPMVAPAGTAPPSASVAERDALLATKLHVPRPRPGLLPRPRLLERLADGVAHELVLVCTPAGFGKTTLLGDWVRRDQQPVAWLSLDEGDNDPVRFWRYVAAALNGAGTGLQEELAPLLRGPYPASPEAAVTVLSNALATQAHRLTLVLDDYHLIDATPVHQGLALLLDRLPAQLHVVVASRADPPLPLARLRARGQLAELREGELRFTPEETAELLGEVMGLELPAATTAALAARTEGWVAGLQLAVLSLQGRTDPAEFIASFSGSHRYVLDYLTEEVLERQPEELRDFLLDTSVLERLSGPLCDAVTGRADSQQLLEGLDRANLFLVPLDEVRGWWRYHQLFADLLQARLRHERPGRAAELHRAAAAWFEEQGLIDEAIHHGLGGGDVGRAALLVEQNFWRLLWRSETATVNRWLSALPAEVVRARPWLCLALAAQAGKAGRLDELEQLLADAERAHARDVAASRPAAARTGSLADDLPTMIAMWRVNLTRVYGDAQPATEFAKQVQAGRAGDDPVARAMVDWALAQPDWMSGRLAQAERALARAAAEFRAAGIPEQAAASCYELIQVQRARGRLDAALASGRQALEISTTIHPGLPPAGTAHVLMAEVSRERNQLDAALEDATRGVALCRQLPFAWALAAGLATLAWIRQAQGDPAGAREAIGEAMRVLPYPRLVELWHPAPAAAARLALAQGRTADAVRWVRGRGLGTDDELSYPKEREYLVLARVLVAERTPDRALPLLERLHAAARAQERTGGIIETRVVQALALAACDDRTAALEALAEALTLAWPEGYVRVFVDEGAPMATLLGRLMKATGARGVLDGGVPPDYLRRLADAFDQGSVPSRRVRRGAAVPGLVEPLSDRELEVLGLLAAGRPNQAIADELVVALDTVKKHVSHVLDKLSAANRTHAVLRARELRLLP
jgi:LuxR family transcriptional regulator, maltose regulon positive regulatory protein